MTSTPREQARAQVEELQAAGARADAEAAARGNDAEAAAELVRHAREAEELMALEALKIVQELNQTICAATTPVPAPNTPPAGGGVGGRRRSTSAERGRGKERAGIKAGIKASPVRLQRRAPSSTPPTDAPRTRTGGPPTRTDAHTPTTPSARKATAELRQEAEALAVQLASLTAERDDARWEVPPPAARMCGSPVCVHTHTLARCFSLSLSLSLSLSHTHTHTHTLSLSLTLSHRCHG